MTKLEFSLLLGKRNIPRQYDEIDLQDDIAYASR
jgi:predicted HTH domain antitoxin